MSGVFVNYRGEDSGTAAALIDRELTAHLGAGQVFLDSRSLPLGEDFAELILGRLRSCGVLLAVIGPRWLEVTDDGGRRRIDDPADWVRREIAEALARQLRVVPVLLTGATLPPAQHLPPDLAALSRRQYAELRHRHIDADLADLVGRLLRLEPALAALASRAPARSPARLGRLSRLSRSAPRCARAGVRAVR